MQDNRAKCPYRTFQRPKRRIAIRGIQWKRQVVETYGKIAETRYIRKSIETLVTRTIQVDHRAGATSSGNLTSVPAGVVWVLVRESTVSALPLPLPQESSRMISPVSGKLGRGGWCWCCLDLGPLRVAEGDAGSVFDVDSCQLPPCIGLATPSCLGELGLAESKNPRHLRQPSKSMRACMQPHSVTFCSSQGNPTGYNKYS